MEFILLVATVSPSRVDACCIGLILCWDCMGPVLFRGASIFVISYSTSPLLFVFSPVVFFTAVHVTAGAGGVGTTKSVAE